MAIAFSLYDFFLCLSDEIDLVWQRRFRYMTVLYFITRHLMIVSLIIDTAYNPGQPQVITCAFRAIFSLRIGLQYVYNYGTLYECHSYLVN